MAMVGGEDNAPHIHSVWPCWGGLGCDPPQKILISRKKLIKKYQTAPKRGGGRGRGAKKKLKEILKSN